MNKILPNITKKISVMMISQSNAAGGAARAASRLFTCLSNERDINFLVANKKGSDPRISQLKFNKKLISRILSRFDMFICNFIEPYNREWQTAAYFGSISARSINKSNYSIINLHWIGHGLISLRQIKKIDKPIVWTLHDEWMINAISHYPLSIEKTVIRNKLIIELVKRIKNNRVKLKKEIILKENVSLVCLNSEVAKKLKIQFPKKENIFTIANPVNLLEFFPENNQDINFTFNHARYKPLVLFLGGREDPRKGWDLLLKSLEVCKASFTLVVIASSNDIEIDFNSKIKIVNLPRIEKLNELRVLYSLVDAVVVPSRVEGLPQTATESISCGTPVIGFSIGGLIDIVKDGKTGFLAKPFSIEGLARAIERTLNLNKKEVVSNCRKFALLNFEFKVVESKYEAIFKSLSCPPT